MLATAEASEGLAEAVDDLHRSGDLPNSAVPSLAGSELFIPEGVAVTGEGSLMLGEAIGCREPLLTFWLWKSV